MFSFCRCDADPQALSKYVLALIKKDKPIEELKSSMISQMDVFLQSETNNFVEMLFKIVDSKEYLNTNASALIKEDKEPVTEKENSPQNVAGKVEEADSTTNNVISIPDTDDMANIEIITEAQSVKTQADSPYQFR